MLTEEQLEAFGDKGAALFQRAEQEIIADIARRVKKTGRFTETAELQAMAMQAAGCDTQKIRAEVMRILNADAEYKKYVANNTKQYKRDVMHAIRQTEREARETGDDIIAEAGNMAYNKDLSAWHQAGESLVKDSAIENLIKTMGKRTGDSFVNLTKTTGFKGAYDFIALKNAYTRSLDKAVMKMATGAMSFDRAVEDTVRELARSGIRSVDYASGRTYQLDTAARMCVRTSCHQLSGEITMQNCENMGTDLVEVSKHWGARPSHAVWQGKIYSRSGRNKEYPPFSECHYGAIDGLCGINCRHTFFPFFEGISEPTKWLDEPEPKEYNGKIYDYYAATQKQRAMERNIRATKREAEAMKSIGADTKDIESSIRKQIKEYHKFSHKVGISPKDNRLRVVKGSSELNKTNVLKKQPKINESRAMEEKAKSLFDVQPLQKGDTVKPVSIYKDLKNSDIGKRVLEYIEKNNVNVEIIYNKDSEEEYGLKGKYGLNVGDDIYINARTCNTKKKIVETIIHEETHLEYNIGYDAHAECVCDYNALKHRKGELTGDDIRNIIKSVKKRYPEYKWRKPE